MDFGIVPVGPPDRRLQIVNHEPLGNAAEVVEGVFQHGDEVVGRLPIDDLAIRLPRTAEHHPQHPRPPLLAVLALNPGGRAEVDLGFFARLGFHPSVWRRRARAQRRTNRRTL